jgi:hypothetical protein
MDLELPKWIDLFLFVIEALSARLTAIIIPRRDEIDCIVITVD